ncbi:MAG: STAS domain-containing protein [Methanospirillum sp.]|nr:STAS domain-containing protein [Methanospirillum sp.]
MQFDRIPRIEIMEIKAELSDDTLILILSGRLDGQGSEELKQALIRNLTDRIRHVLFDLKDSPYLSSNGIRVFLLARKMVQERSGTVMLCCVPEFPMNILSMAGLNRVFPIYQDQREALSSVCMIHEESSSSASIPELCEVAGGKMEIRRIGEGTAALRISGSLTRVLHAGIRVEDISRIRFSNCEYSLGLGALAENPEQARHLLGEMITLHGSIVWLPTDGMYIPDFFTPVRNSGNVEIYSGFAAALQGPFHEYADLKADQPGGISLSGIYQAIFRHAREKYPDYSGIVAMTLIGRSSGVRSSGIRHSPIVENAPIDGGSIMDPAHVKDWIEVTDTPGYVGETIVAFGVGIDLMQDLSRFTREQLTSLYYIHPSNRVSQEMFLHNHGVIFKYAPVPQVKEIGREIRRLIITGEFLDMRHLMDDTKVKNARIAVSYISGIDATG